MLDAGADGWSVEEIPREIETRKLRAKLFNGGKPGQVAKIVLWQRARPNCYMGKNRFVTNAYERRNFAMHLSGEFLNRLLHRSRICGATHETRQQCIPLWSAVGEKG